MKAVLRIIFLVLAAFYASALATVINIPADYPAIQQGIESSSDGDTVLVQPGIYVENINFNSHSIVLGSMYLLTGDESYISSTRIDGNGSGHVIVIANGEDSTTAVVGFTVENGYSLYGAGFEIFQSSPTIEHNIIRDNFGENGSGGIECFDADARIKNNIIDNNFGRLKAGGIYSAFCDPIISGNLIINNSSELWGAGITCYQSGALIINNTLYHNTAPQGGGIACWLDSDPVIENTILWRNTPQQIYTYSGSNPAVSYCDVDGGWPGVGNIDVNPEFRNYGNDFRLKSVDCGYNRNSPCIDVGDPTIQDYLLNCDWGLGTQLSDMGAYGGGDSTLQTVEDYYSPMPKRLTLLQNYPNPFNASTNISFLLSQRSYVSLSIYNILGQEVESLFEGLKEPGSHTISWDAAHQPSGVYFMRLKAGNYSKNIRMLLLK